MVHKFFVAFIPIFVAIDPVGLVAVFIGLAGNSAREHATARGSPESLRRFALQLALYFSGRLSLARWELPWRILGGRGLILLGLAGRELLNLAPADREASDDFGVVPLGMPLIAGPALLTALLILADTVGLVFTLISLVANLALVAIASGMPIW